MKVKLFAEGPREQASLFVIYSTNAEFREFFSGAPLVSGGYVGIRGIDRDPFLRIEGPEVLAQEERSKASLFVFYRIEAGVKVVGQPIRSGDYVYIRSTDHDPYLAVKGNEVVAGRETDASVFVVYKTNGLNTAPIDGAELRSGDYVILRGVQGDPYLKLVSVGAPPSAPTSAPSPAPLQYPRIASLEITPDAISAGQSTTMTVRLQGPVPRGGMVVHFAWSGGLGNFVRSFPTQVLLSERQTQASVPIVTQDEPTYGNPVSVYTWIAYFQNGNEIDKQFSYLKVTGRQRAF